MTIAVMENAKTRKMKTYNWWLGKKRRVRKKYTLFLGKYMSPKELRLWRRGRFVRGAKYETD